MKNSEYNTTIFIGIICLLLIGGMIGSILTKNQPKEELSLLLETTQAQYWQIQDLKAQLNACEWDNGADVRLLRSTERGIVATVETIR